MHDNASVNSACTYATNTCSYAAIACLNAIYRDCLFDIRPIQLLYNVIVTAAQPRPALHYSWLRSDMDARGDLIDEELLTLLQRLDVHVYWHADVIFECTPWLDIRFVLLTGRSYEPVRHYYRRLRLRMRALRRWVRGALSQWCQIYIDLIEAMHRPMYITHINVVIRRFG